MGLALCTGTAHLHDGTDSKRPQSGPRHHGRYCHHQRGPDDAVRPHTLICAGGAARLVVPELRLLGGTARTGTGSRTEAAITRVPHAASSFCDTNGAHV
jgi:hypothetical protein